MLRSLIVPLLILSFPSAALAAPGALDPTFAGGAGRTTVVGPDASSFALAPDGSIAVGGTDIQAAWNQFAHMRFTASGARTTE